MKILLLGSTGSIGTSTCNCVRRFSSEFEITGLAVNNNVEDLAKLVNEFNIPIVYVGNPSKVDTARSILPDNVKILHGKDGLVKIVKEAEYDVLLNALVGAVGFLPTVTALKLKKRVALANKESLVIGGDVIQSLIDNGFGSLTPVDSEHSAIQQCLLGEDSATIENLIITASGGPFRLTPLDKFSEISVEQALDHPTWKMGSKITIDAATLMNKGFEVIEAHHLFNMPYDKIKVLIHPESIIHSMVEFHDGAVIAQCGLPDMELPIQFALSYPKRLPLMGKRLDLASITSLNFETPNLNKFKCLSLAIEAGTAGGTLPIVLNASNEIAVQAFLDKKIKFNSIADIIDSVLQSSEKLEADTIEIVTETDKLTRELTIKKITEGKF